VRDKTTLKENDRILIGTSIMKLTRNVTLKPGRLG